MNAVGVGMSHAETRRTRRGFGIGIGSVTEDGGRDPSAGSA
jgi:hypothetical protein